MNESRFLWLMKGAELLVIDLEVHIYSVQELRLDFREQILRHRNVGVALPHVIISLFTNLNSCRVEWHILILVARKQADVFEPVQAVDFGEPKEASLLHDLVVAHAKLLKGFGLPPFFQKPHPRIK